MTMETRRVERLRKGVLGLRYGGQTWVTNEDSSVFHASERPLVGGDPSGNRITVRSVDGARQEQWQRLQVMPPLTMYPRFSVQWSDEDKQYVGTCSKFPSMSFLDDFPDKALMGIIRLVEEAKL